VGALLFPPAIFSLYSFATCGQATLKKKIVKLILKLKFTEFDFRWGSAAEPYGGAYSVPPDLLTVFKSGLLLKRGGKIKRKKEKREKNEKKE